MTMKPTNFDTLSIATMNGEQLDELAGVLARIVSERRVLDERFTENLKTLASYMHPEPQEQLINQVEDWNNAIASILNDQSAEINRILGIADQGDEPGETLQ